MWTQGAGSVVGPSLLVGCFDGIDRAVVNERSRMAFCSFGGENNPCGAVQWAAHDSSMMPLLSCQCDLSSWLKDKYGGSGASGSRGRPTVNTSSSCSGKK